jgi:phenylpropionate dioxygenase-like ring-hydroxylating dioxygenase large terminal subunit
MSPTQRSTQYSTIRMQPAKAPLPGAEALRAALAEVIPGHALPRSFYKHPDIFQQDLRHFVMAHWHCAGHVSMAPAPGDYFTLEIAGESVIVVRGNDGELRAMLNVCRHRGSRVCNETEGHLKGGLMVCPYHAWTYGCSGELQRARMMPEDFDKDSHGLHQVPLRVAAGLVFITFAEQPLGFTHVREAFEQSLDVYGWGRAKVAARRTYQINANWKLVEENYQECYHCGPAHQEYSKRHVFARPQEQRVAPDARMAERDAALGLALGDYDAFAEDVEPGQESADCSRSAIVDGYHTGSRDGRPVAPLMGQFKDKDYDGGFSFVDVGPTSNFVAYPDYGLIYRTVPLSVDKTEFELIWLVDQDAVEGRDYQVEQLIWMWDYTSAEDKKIIELNQAGVDSAWFEPGPYAPMEADADRYIRWYLNTLRVAAMDK